MKERPAQKLKRIACLIVVMSAMGSFVSLAAESQQVPPKSKDQLVQAKVQPDKIVPAPQNIRERTAIYVFVAWLWAAIFVLISIVRLEIKEADRVLDLRFYREEKK